MLRGRNQILTILRCVESINMLVTNQTRKKMAQCAHDIRHQSQTFRNVWILQYHNPYLFSLFIVSFLKFWSGLFFLTLSNIVFFNIYSIVFNLTRFFSLVFSFLFTRFKVSLQFLSFFLSHFWKSDLFSLFLSIFFFFLITFLFFFFFFFFFFDVHLTILSFLFIFPLFFLSFFRISENLIYFRFSYQFFSFF